MLLSVVATNNPEQNNSEGQQTITQVEDPVNFANTIMFIKEQLVRYRSLSRNINQLKY
jgi:hypothetical protein